MDGSSLRQVRGVVARCGVALVLLASCTGHLNAKDAQRLTGFYVLSMVTSDASPFWYHYVLDVREEGRDSIVRYIRIAPMDGMCAQVTTVKAAIVRLAGVSPSDLIPQSNLCEIDAPAVNRELQRRVRTAAIDDSARVGIVASCGERSVILHLPFPEQVKLERLRKAAPQLAGLWDIQNAVRGRAFGSVQVFYDTTVDQEERLNRDGESVVPELLGGRFDAGLLADCAQKQPCESPAFRHELQTYVGPLGESGREGKLAQAQQYRFSRYVAPKYPALAMQSRIGGTVKLNLTVDTATGNVRDIKVVSGHPIFRSAVLDAVALWRFFPGEVPRNGEDIPADLVFEWGCPTPIVK